MIKGFDTIGAFQKSVEAIAIAKKCTKLFSETIIFVDDEHPGHDAFLSNQPRRVEFAVRKRVTFYSEKSLASSLVPGRLPAAMVHCNANKRSDPLSR